MGDTGYFFIPAARRGLARAIHGLSQTGRVVAAFDLKLEAEKVEGGLETPAPTLAIPRVELYGPGDILGFDEQIITRRDPRPDIGDFEPNFLPMVEFADVDFPWRFTPDVAADKGLTPWITLVVLERDSGEYLECTPARRGLPCCIKADVTKLPDLAETWRWAHVMVTADAAGTSVAQTLITDAATDPDRIVSRILCPRHLSPNTRYRAFIVPSFALGRLAGLGQPLSAATPTLAFSWSVRSSGQPTTEAAADPERIDLPYYARWDFSTGARGDFEYLVRLLEPRLLTGLGRRDMVCPPQGDRFPGVNRAGVDLPHSVALEGALCSFDFSPTQWGRDATDGGRMDPARQALAGIVNTPQVDALPQSLLGQATGVSHYSDAAQDPVVAPPIYGRWHAAQPFVAPSASSWCDAVNLDPRHRAAAGVGVLVVQRLQEELMASAWRQLGAVEKMNEVLRSAQVGRESSTIVFRRVGRLSAGPFLRIMAPVAAHVRLITATGARTTFSVTARLMTSRLPSTVLDPAFRRIIRFRGPIRRRQFRAQPEAAKAFLAQPDVLIRLNDGTVSAATVAPPSGRDMFGICQVTRFAFGAQRLFVPSPIPTPSPVPAPITPPARASRAQATVSPVGTPANVAGIPAVAVGGGPLEGGGVPGPVVVPGTGGGAPIVVTGSPMYFCEEDVTPQALASAISYLTTSYPALFRPWSTALAGGLPAVAEALTWLNVPHPEPTNTTPAPIGDAVTSLRKAVDPRVSIEARTLQRLKLVGVPARRDQLETIMAAPEFPQPMYKPLAEISQDLVLPGLDCVPQNTLSLLKVNMRFIESYMCGCNHEFAGELLWREYPTDQRGSYFRQFFQIADAVNAASVPGSAEPGAVPENMKDLKRLHTWGRTELGTHGNRPLNPLVLLIRGDLLKKYPNTLVYAVPALRSSDGVRRPDLEGFISQPGLDSVRKFPVITGSLAPDVTFFGFLLTEDQVRGLGGSEGWYFVLEERVSEARFGIKEGEQPATATAGTSPGDGSTTADLSSWRELVWTHFNGVTAGKYIDGTLPNVTDRPPAPPPPGQSSSPTQRGTSSAAIGATPPNDPSRPPVPPPPGQSSPMAQQWNTSSAAIAAMLVQDPVRVAVHAEKMLPLAKHQA
jgi:hypothetical protein